LAWALIATIAPLFFLAYYLFAAPTGWLLPIFALTIVYPLRAVICYRSAPKNAFTSALR